MSWRRLIRCSLIAIVALLAVSLAVSWFVGSSLVAPANRVVGEPPVHLIVESLTIESNSGSTLAAWYLPLPESRATVILVHPIRVDRRAMLTRATMLREAGYATLLIDLQAHGASQGNHITAGYRERHDVAAAVEYIRLKDPEHQIGVIGWSLGGAATLLASPLEINALVLESVYPTITEAVDNRVAERLGPLHYVATPILLTQLKLRLGISPAQLRPIDYIANAGCPVLVASGELDRHTTLAETRRLYNAACDPKQLVVFEGAEHTDLLSHDPEKYKTQVIGFLNAHLPTQQETPDSNMLPARETPSNQ